MNQSKLTFLIIFIISVLYTFPRIAGLAILERNANNINSNTSTYQIQRYDTTDLAKKYLLKPVTFNISRTDPMKKLTTAKKLAPGVSPFEVTYVCTASEPVCEKVKFSFDSAMNKIASALNINTQITVEAVFYSFCGDIPASKCVRKNVLGQAAAGSYFKASLDPEAQPSYFPQALLKQLDTTIALPYNHFDIKAEFNTDYEFWYEMDNTPMGSNKIDLEFVIAHEVTHGLGFDSFLYPWSFWFDGFIQMDTDFVGPSTLAKYDDNGDLVLGSTRTWDLSHIFDQQLYDKVRNTTIQCYLNEMYDFRMLRDTKMQTFYETFLNNTTSRNAAMKLTEALTSGKRKTVFVNSFNDGKYPYVSTFVGYDLGSSVAHLDYFLYWNTSDFLMVHAIGANSGETLSNMIKKHNTSLTPMYGPFGRMTLQILDTIGWPTVLRKKATTIAYIPIYNGIDMSLIGTFTGPSGPQIDNECKPSSNTTRIPSPSFYPLVITDTEDLSTSATSFSETSPSNPITNNTGEKSVNANGKISNGVAISGSSITQNFWEAILFLIHLICWMNLI